MRTATRHALFATLTLNLVCLLSGVPVTSRIDARSPDASRQEKAPSATPDLAALERLAAAILRADYEGDRAGLERLAGQMRVPPGNPHASRVVYWRGFAYWRRAFNGFSSNSDRADIERDLQQAIREFEQVLVHDGAFVDAKVGVVSCLQSLAFLYGQDPARLEPVVRRMVVDIEAARTAAPDNPRLLWVYGSAQFYARPGTAPEEIAARQARAMATWERGVTLAREQASRPAAPLEPVWGEPELLMNLAWGSLNRVQADARQAEAYATRALALVPHWRYLRDVLLPQIRAKRGSSR